MQPQPRINGNSKRIMQSKRTNPKSSVHQRLHQQAVSRQKVARRQTTGDYFSAAEVVANTSQINNNADSIGQLVMMREQSRRASSRSARSNRCDTSNSSFIRPE